MEAALDLLFMHEDVNVIQALLNNSGINMKVEPSHAYDKSTWIGYDQSIMKQDGVKLTVVIQNWLST